MTTSQLCISILAVEQEQAALTDVIEKFLIRYDVPRAVAVKVQIALDEILTNISSHAYAPDTADRFARICLTIDTQSVTMVIVDAGRPFDPFTAPTPDATLDIDDREIGGLGILLVRRQMDEMRYARVGEENILTLVKSLT